MREKIGGGAIRDESVSDDEARGGERSSLPEGVYKEEEGAFAFEEAYVDGMLGGVALYSCVDLASSARMAERSEKTSERTQKLLGTVFMSPPIRKGTSILAASSSLKP